MVPFRISPKMWRRPSPVSASRCRRCQTKSISPLMPFISRHMPSISPLMLCTSLPMPFTSQPIPFMNQLPPIHSPCKRLPSFVHHKLTSPIHQPHWCLMSSMTHQLSTTNGKHVEDDHLFANQPSSVDFVSC